MKRTTAARKLTATKSAKIKPKQGAQIKLRAVAEMASLVFVLLRNNPRLTSLTEMGKFAYRMMLNPGTPRRMRLMDQNSLDEGINFASFIAAMEAEPLWRNKTAEGKVRAFYTHLRLNMFDSVLPLLSENPLFRDKKCPSEKQNKQMMQMVWDSLADDPDVQAEIESQSQAGTLYKWRKKQHDLAVNSYHKVRKRLEDNFNKHKEQLKKEIEADWPTIQTPVNPPDDDFHTGKDPNKA